MDLNNLLFGPLGKNWCSLFYFFSILYFVIFFLMVGLTIFYLAGKNANGKLSFLTAISSLTPLLAYFIMRILHGMCVK